MTGRGSDARARATRFAGGERKVTRAEQLRALGIPYRCIARELRVDREVISRWFALQDDLSTEHDTAGHHDR